MLNRRRGLCAALLAAVVAVTAGCGTGDSAAPARPEVDLAALDVGNLNAEPKYYDKPTSLDMARLVEAMRLGNHLPLPMEIDPEVKYAPTRLAAVRTFTATSSAAISNRFQGDTAALGGRISGFVAGFVTAGRTDTTHNLSWDLDNIAMLFETEQDATRAADAFTEVERAALGPDIQIQSIPGFPEARAHSAPSIPGAIHSYYAVGKFLLFTEIRDNTMYELRRSDPDELRNRVARSVEKMKPALESFTPTPVSKLMELDVDPEQTLARALNTVDDPGQSGIPGVYDRHGGLQIGFNPEADSRMFEKAGVDSVAWKGGYVYRTNDARAARWLIDERADVGKFYRRAPAPAALPFAQCLQYIGPASGVAYYCGVSFDRYAAEVTAGQLQDAQQRISAQYAILARAK
ncbi:DUF7373 family lipoprotein [Nocardia asteroides]|uniref:DUF7373 family lipoprotein n=1 Tax=Nocardia asteroides TaxID=1824 RepID=UPI001E498BED|nr:hypothetical protein [Nocardia asteroides]UGT60038.1 hypothetical protein LTT61_22840 [Nocardia asteroides]